MLTKLLLLRCEPTTEQEHLTMVPLISGHITELRGWLTSQVMPFYQTLKKFRSLDG